jgi:hypothetical protein
MMHTTGKYLKERVKGVVKHLRHKDYLLHTHTVLMNVKNLQLKKLANYTTALLVAPSEFASGLGIIISVRFVESEFKSINWTRLKMGVHTRMRRRLTTLYRLALLNLLDGKKAAYTQNQTFKQRALYAM